MKTILFQSVTLCLLSIINVSTLFAQSTFFQEYSTYNALMRNRIVEAEDNTLLIINNEENTYLNEIWTCIYKIDSNGDIKQVKEIYGPNGARIGFITKGSIPGQFIIAGHTDSISNGNVYTTSFISIIDNELTVLDSKELETIENREDHFRNIQMVNDSIIYLLEHCYSSPPDRWWLKVYKTNTNSGEFSFYESAYTSDAIPTDMIVHEDESVSVFYFGDSLQREVYFNWILNLDKDLVYQSSIPQPDDIYIYSFADWISDTSYILSAMAYTEYLPLETCRAIYVYEMSDSHDSINSVRFFPDYPEDTILYPFFNNNIAIADYRIAIGGVYNLSIYGFPTQPTPCWVQLTLFDYDLNMEKQLYYGDGVKAYYGMDIIATSDGGFAMCGLVNDPQNTTNPQPDMFVLKVNSEGLMTGNNEVEQPEVTEVILWPNPGNDVIHLKSASQLTNASFELYNPSGILCLTQKLSAGTHQTINTEHLTAGIYPYRIINGNRVVKTGKWIKK